MLLRSCILLRLYPLRARLAIMLVIVLTLTWVGQHYVGNDASYGSGGRREKSAWNVLSRVFANEVELAGGAILITGGGGNIGKHLIRRLQSGSPRIPLVVIDPIFQRDELLPFTTAAATPYSGLNMDHPLFTYYPGDIRNETLLSHIFSTHQIAGVINLAAVSRVLWCLENQADCTAVNVEAVSTLLSQMSSDGADRATTRLPWLVQASSREVYGDTKPGQPIAEFSGTVPSNVYGTSKLRAEEAIQSFIDEQGGLGGSSGEGHRDGLHAIALRLSNVYGGEHDHRERLIPAMMTQAIAHRTIQMVGGDQFLDMVHIDDVVDAIILSVQRLHGRVGRRSFGLLPSVKPAMFEQFNVAAGRAVSAIELVRKILHLTRSNSPIQTIPSDASFPARYEGSTDLATRVLGFTAKVGIDEGLVRLARAYYWQTQRYLVDKRERESQARSYSRDDLIRLSGCTVNVVGKSRGEMSYLDLDLHTQDMGQKWRWSWTFEPRSYDFNLTEKADGKLGFRLGHERRGLYEVVNVTLGDGSHTDFEVEIDESTGYVFLSVANDGGYFLPPSAKNISTRVSPDKPAQPSFRIIPVCCEKPAPWPFIDEDPLASAINDLKYEKTAPFAGSQHRTLCDRVTRALQVVEDHLDRLDNHLPLHLDQAEMPTGKPHEWRHRHMKTCTNLCDHPTTCLDTGDCACVLSSCTSIDRFPFASVANLDQLSYPPVARVIDPNDDQSLINLVKQKSWLNVLRPAASRYLAREPELPKVHVTQLPPAVQGHRLTENWKYDRFLPGKPGCYSADSMLERGLRSLNTSYGDDHFTFLPYFQGSLWYPDVESWRQYALTEYLPHSFDESKWIVPFSHDWGVCNTFTFDIFTIRYKKSTAIPVVRHRTAWSVMGDLNSDCYRYDMDVVIPPRACLMPKLVVHYGDLTDVRPSRQRRTLTTFKATYMGTGAQARRKTTCSRPFDHFTSPALEGGNELQTVWNGWGDYPGYLALLADTIFCPLVRGTTGWATRTIDSIYAGCIPVIFGDQTHLVFWDVLDWSKFSITVLESDMDRLEEILLGYTWEQVAELQANLMLVRDAFIYPLDDDFADQVEQKGPLFYALHSTALTGFTRYPV